MQTFRIGSTRYAGDLTGQGARINGGRWNNIGTPCIYSSASRALALLEYTVNVKIDLIPRALSFTVFEFPDDNEVSVPVADLPGNWKDVPSPATTKAFGTAMLQANDSLVLKIPSTVIPAEFNYIINPAHANFPLVNILSVTDFVYDMRIKT